MARLSTIIDATPRVTLMLPIFLSVVTVVHNRDADLRRFAAELAAQLPRLVSDYELIYVDNASDDCSLETLRAMASPDGLPNLQVYALTKEVDEDTACSVGLENALGDFIAFVDISLDDIAFLPAMLEHAVAGADVVFATNTAKAPQSFAYRFGSRTFDLVYSRLCGVSLDQDAPRYRVLSRRVANFILQHPMPAITYRHLPATGGFSRAKLTYSSPARGGREKKLMESVDRGMRLLVSTTRAPMRLVTTLCLFGAAANLVYSGYVIAVALLKEDVAPGWVTLSLQQSGMFLLVSLVLLVLSEYILQMASLTSEGPRYHVAQEFTSAVMTRRARINVEEPAQTLPLAELARVVKQR